MTPQRPEPDIIGWDIGGAHVKACLMRGGEVLDVAQWACPLWQGLDRLERVLTLAHGRWRTLDAARHAVTMTGEMADLFADREDGVRRIAAVLVRWLHGAVHFFAGDAGWCDASEVPRLWERVASANWLATARHTALRLAEPGHAEAGGTDEGVLVDIGSTSTDLIAFRAGRVLTTSRSDVQRLASGELVYHGVVRTPLCALAQRIGFRGIQLNVMNELFATTADVYRLTGELDPAHDLQPSADNTGKDLLATRRRLARMVGMDEREASADDWLAFARAWRQAQVDAIAGELERVLAAHALAATAQVVSAGCGDFLVADVLKAATATAATTMRPCLAYGSAVARVSAQASGGTTAVAAWTQVCAPSAAVAALFERERL